MKRFLIRMAVIAGIAAAFICLWMQYRSEHRERRRLEANQHSLLTDIQFYRTRDSLSAGELEKTVNALQLKVHRLQSASRTAVETHYPVTVRLRDTVVLRDTLTVADTLRHLHYETPWLMLDGAVCGDLFRGDVLSRDTLVQVVHRVPRRFWFIRWGTKAIRQEVTTRNPYSRITYTEYLELKRRKKR